MRIIYIPLEPYEERYTLQLLDWNVREFKRLGIDHLVIEGKKLYQDNEIKTGLVLDVHQRTFWALSQSQRLIELHAQGNLNEDDFILFEDMFHPGIEALAYCFALSHHRPKIGVRCLAQTIDPDDFVHYTKMARWMRHYEAMVNSFVDVVFAASQEMLSFMTAAGWRVPVVVTGLPFGKKEVMSRCEFVANWNARPLNVVFASRIADEKQPEFLVAVARTLKIKQPQRIQLDSGKWIPPVYFTILSGGIVSHPLIMRAVIDGVIELRQNLAKNEYYKYLANAKVLFNCSLQDWVSNTVSEADTLGCNLVFPAYRSFPEVFNNDSRRLYIPWSVEDAVEKLSKALTREQGHKGEISDYQDKTIERTVHAIADIMGAANFEEAVLPQNTNYRKEITRQAVKGYQL